MTEVQIKLRYNETTEDVELVVGEEVVGSAGPELFKGWVNLYNEKHPLPVPEPVVVPPPAPVVEPPAEPVVDTTPEPVVD